MPTILNKSLGSADLTKPDASLGWLIKGTLAVAALFLVLGFGQHLAGIAGSEVAKRTGIATAAPTSVTSFGRQA